MYTVTLCLTSVQLVQCTAVLHSLHHANLCACNFIFNATTDTPSTAASPPVVGLGASIVRGLLRVRGASLELKHTKLKVLLL